MSTHAQRTSLSKFVTANIDLSKTGNVRIKKNWGAFVHPLLQQKINKYYKFCVCIFTLRSPACNVHAPHYIVICGMSGCTLFFQTVSLKSMIFKKKKKNYWTQNVCFDFLYNFVWKFSYSKKNWVSYDHKCTLVIMWSACHSCQILMKLEFSRQIFER